MATTTILTSSPIPLPSPGIHFFSESWLSCYSTPKHTWRNRCDCLLATEQPLSVIPPSAFQMLDIVIAPVPGWKGNVPTWFGIPCRIGRVTLWLPNQEEPGRLRDFQLLVLAPKFNLEDAAPFIHLGTQFLLEYRVQVILEGESPTSGGKLIIP